MEKNYSNGFFIVYRNLFLNSIIRIQLTRRMMTNYNFTKLPICQKLKYNSRFSHNEEIP